MSRAAPSFYGHDWVGLYLAGDLEGTAERLRFYADFLDGKARLLREQMVLASPVEDGSSCHWCDGRRIIEIGESRAIDCPACSASAIEAQSGETVKHGSTEGESAVPVADA